MITSSNIIILCIKITNIKASCVELKFCKCKYGNTPPPPPAIFGWWGFRDIFCDINRTKLYVMWTDWCYKLFKREDILLWSALFSSLYHLPLLLICIYHFQCKKTHWPGVLRSLTMKASGTDYAFSLSPSLCLITLLIKMTNAEIPATSCTLLILAALMPLRKYFQIWFANICPFWII